MSYYHVSRGPEESKIFTNLDKNKWVFFAMKDTFWNYVEKDVGKIDYGGYREYELNLESNLFTESFYPEKEGLILKITDNNVKSFKKILKSFLTEDHILNRNGLIEELKQRKFNGIDCHFYIDIAGYNSELIIFNILPFIKDMKLIEIFKVE